jgi:hypothetical protein
LSTTARHPVGVVVGYTQASSVIPVVNCSDADEGTVTTAFVPLNTSALPNFPAVVHVAPLIVPVLLLPEASATVVPAPSAKLYAATSPATVFGVVAFATLEYGPRLGSASVARTR